MQLADLYVSAEQYIHQHGKFTWLWFLNNGVHVMPWPPVSPDLNPMINTWRRVFFSIGKYVAISEVKTTIISHYEEFDQIILKGFFHFMSDRVFH